MDCFLQNQTYTISANSEPCTPKKTELTSSFQSVKPWFFKPRKIKYGLQGDFKKIKKYNSLHWSQEENEKYVNFLKGFLELIKGDTLQKRKYHLNRMLSKQIGSRSPIQCRSHHQKMIKAFKTPQAIIHHFQNPLKPQPTNETFNSQTQTPKEEPKAQLPQKVNYGTSTQNESPKQCSEVSFIGQNNMFMNDQASLWDILTYPGLQNTFDDLF